MIVRYNPWNEMATLNRFFGRWMDDTMSGGASQQNDWNMDIPALDVKETNDGFEIVAELPGWKPDDIDVTVEQGVLTLKGALNEAPGERPDSSKTAKWHSREIRRTSFVRSLTLPAQVQADKAVAHFENGLLTLMLPKAEVVKPKQIKIAMNNGSGKAIADQ